MITTRLTKKLAAAAAVLGIAAGCGTTSSAPPATTSAPAAPTPISIQLTWLPQYQFAGYYVAEALGYYKKAGLDVTIHPGGPGITPVQNVLTGADTVGLASPDQILKAQAQGINVVGMMADFQHSPTGFMVMANSGITSPRQFAGKTVAVNFGGNTEIEFQALMAKVGVPQSAMHEVQLQFNLAPFLSGQVQVWPVFVTDEPNTAEQDGAHIRVITPEQYGIDFYEDVLFTKASTLASQKPALAKFVAATQQGWLYAIQHPAAADKILLKVNPQLSPSHLTFETDHTIPLIWDATTKAHGFGYMTASRWNQIEQTLLSLHLLSQPVPVSKVFTDSLVSPAK